MASVTVFTSTVPTRTVYATSTILSEDERTRRSRIRSTGTVTLVVLTTDADGDEVAETSEVETVITSTSTIISTATSTIVTSVPVETLFSTSLSTSTLPTTSSTSISSTTSLSPVRSRSSSSSSSSDEVVVVTQFTTVTPVQTTSTSAPVLSASTSTGPFGPVVSSSANARTAGMSGDEASANTSSSRSALSTGAIAGIAVGAVAVAVILGILGFMFCCRRRNGRRDSMYATTGGRSDERLAASVFNPGYQSSPPMRSYSSSGRQMANIGAAGASVIAGAGAAAAAGNRNSRRSSKDPGYAGVGAGRRASSGNGNSAPTSGRNKPVPDVPPPVSNLTFARPSLAQRQSSDESDMSSKYYAQNQRQSQTYGNQAPSRSYRLSDGAGPAYAPVPTRTPPQNRQGNRVSAPVGNSLAPPGPQLGQEERAAALKRAKSAASIASIPTEKLGKGAGYASPMPPMDPLGKPMDQKTWRERQKLVKSGEFLPDKHLTEEQKTRRDSQLAKLQAAQAGTASAKPGLSNLQEQDELALSRSRSPPRVSQMPILAPTPVAPAPAPQSSLPNRPVSAPGTSNRDSASLPYMNPSSPAPTYATRNPFAGAAPRSPPPNSSIYPSLPPSSPHRNVAPGAPSGQPSYQIYQPPQPGAYNPIRASFGASVGQQNQGPPPAPSGSKNDSRLPSIPGSRPTSMALPSSPAVTDNFRRHSNAHQGTNADSPYTPAAATNAQQSAGGFFQQANRSSSSFSPHRGVPSTSIADDVYGGLTSGLSDRDILRLSMSQQQQSQRGKK